ncbi:NAD(P)/FAD-dependent oxidoreductase [Jatrophihabitans fulvus]
MDVDVVVVGGGAAGSAAATALARSRRSVVVIDGGRPRNASSPGVHNLLGRDGIAPGELVATAHDEVRRYGGTVRAGEAVGARRVAYGFEVRLADGGTASARRLVVASGVVDGLPDVPGLRERWGRDVLHCPYCHGWEVRDQAIGVLATSAATMHQTLLFRQLSDDVVVFAHGRAIAPEDAEQLEALGVRVEPGVVAAIETDGDALSAVRLADGRRVTRQALVVAPAARAHSAVLDDLGLVLTEPEPGSPVPPAYACDPTGATAVPGVWVAGNVREPMATVPAATAQGVMAGAAVNGDLVAEDARAAVARLRAARQLVGSKK